MKYGLNGIRLQTFVFSLRSQDISIIDLGGVEMNPYKVGLMLGGSESPKSRLSQGDEIGVKYAH